MIEPNNISFEYDNYIGIYKNVYPEGYCQHLINEFERLKDLGAGSNRKESENADGLSKQDYQITLSMVNPQHFNDRSVEKMFFKGLQICYNKYVEMFPALSHVETRAQCMKMQKTTPGGGYHIWHSEQGNGKEASRSVVYMLYLNSLDPEEAGETEFIHQKKRISPTENTMLIWPASYTHTHRGNTVLGERSKYVITGWFYNV